MRDLPTCKRIALFKAADVLVSTAIREAVNLFPSEYALTKGEEGVVVVSEFSGASRILSGALRVNPWQTDDLITTMVKAMNMSTGERRARYYKHEHALLENTATKWAERVLSDIKEAAKPDSEENYQVLGLGLDTRLMHLDRDFLPLDPERVIFDYRASFRRLILLDYGGTIVTGRSRLMASLTASRASRKYDLDGQLLAAEAVAKGGSELNPNEFRERPPAEVVEKLRLLCRDPCNSVFVLSGKETSWMEWAFADIPGLGLVAEHGYDWRAAGPSTDPGATEWQTLFGVPIDSTWMPTAEQIMANYVLRTR